MKKGWSFCLKLYDEALFKKNKKNKQNLKKTKK